MADSQKRPQPKPTPCFSCGKGVEENRVSDFRRSLPTRLLDGNGFGCKMHVDLETARGHWGRSHGRRSAHGPHLAGAQPVGAGPSLRESGSSSGLQHLVSQAPSPSCRQRPLWAPRPRSPSEAQPAEGPRATHRHWWSCPCAQQAEVAGPGQLQAPWSGGDLCPFSHRMQALACVRSVRRGTGRVCSPAIEWCAQGARVARLSARSLSGRQSRGSPGEKSVPRAGFPRASGALADAGDPGPALPGCASHLCHGGRGRSCCSGPVGSSRHCRRPSPSPPPLAPRSTPAKAGRGAGAHGCVWATRLPWTLLTGGSSFVLSRKRKC